jgi:hypothetical protein
MDQKYDEIFSSLRQKIKAIISAFEQQKLAYNALLDKNREMSEKMGALEEKMKNIEKNYDSLKMAKVLSSISNEDIHDTKIQVNKIVREIDKCIALLNR